MPTEIPSLDFRVTVGSAPSCTQPYSASIFNVSAMSFGALSGNAILRVERRREEGRLRARHGRRLDQPVPPRARRRPDLGSRVGLLRLPRRARPLQRGTVRRERDRHPSQDDRGEAEPGREARPRRRVAGLEGDGRDRGDARRAARRRLREPRTPQRVRDAARAARSSSSGCASSRAASRRASSSASAIRGSGSRSARRCSRPGSLPDFIVVDGSEGGTGAAPLEFVDHVGTPLQEGLLLVHNTLVGLNLRHRIKIGCSGKIISAFDIARAMALGADWCNSARGFMFALGCLQAQTCHTGQCPTGVATQDPLRQQALAVPDKLERVYRFHHHTLGRVCASSRRRRGSASERVSRDAPRAARARERRAAPANVLPQVRPGELLEALRGPQPLAAQRVRALLAAGGLAHLRAAQRRRRQAQSMSSESYTNPQPSFARALGAVALRIDPQVAVLTSPRRAAG